MRCLKPGISQEQAESRLRKSLRRRVWMRPGRLRRVELIWIPFHLFACLFRTGGEEREIRTIADALTGEMVSTLDQTVELDEARPEGPAAPARLAPEEVWEAAREHTRWLVIQSGMLGGKKGETGACDYVETIAYPFWVGYLEKGKRYDVRVVDGVTGESTGPKVKRLVLSALLALQNSAPADSQGETASSDR